jgi:hypothetical protein
MYVLQANSNFSAVDVDVHSPVRPLFADCHAIAPHQHLHQAVTVLPLPALLLLLLLLLLLASHLLRAA